MVAKRVVSIAFAVRAVESLVFGSTTLTFDERAIALLPEVALTVSDEEDDEEPDLDENISQIFSTKEIIPSVGQGVIALQCRKNDSETIQLLDKVNHKLTNICVIAERQFLKVLEGDCETPVGAIANLVGDQINLEAELFSIDGKQRFYHKASKNINYSSELGREVGEILKKESNNSYKR